MRRALAVCTGDDALLRGEGVSQGARDLEERSDPMRTWALRVARVQPTSSFSHPRFAALTPWMRTVRDLLLHFLRNQSSYRFQNGEFSLSQECRNRNSAIWLFRQKMERFSAKCTSVFPSRLLQRPPLKALPLHWTAPTPNNQTSPLVSSSCEGWIPKVDGMKEAAPCPNEI